MKITVLGIVLILGLISCKNEELDHTDTLTIDESIEKYKDSVELLVQRGRIYLETFEFKLAMSDAAKAFRLDSNKTVVKRFYADVLNNRPGRTIEDTYIAQRHYEELLKTDVKNHEILVDLASTYSMQQDFDKAFEYINQALKINPRFRQAYQLKGSIYRALGQTDLMKSSYETAVQQDPKFYEGYLMLGAIYQDENNPLCIEYFTTASRLKPKEAEARYSLAYSKQHFGKEDDAAQLYREMSKDTSDYYASQAWFQLGHMKQFRFGDLDSAKYFYTQAIKKEPRLYQAYHNLGICYDREGDKTNALRSFSRALKHNPEFEISRQYADSIRFL
ncbi:MAG: tetratricopeptide repeat protein [Crocinitomicaceae bacterium]|nr:tetratricopeptide repeat protein [Flavobacteriales bacterium]NQZ37131.1 tetratricopeptide repeat protein [Crocinitomicaceae bacterium]